MSSAPIICEILGNIFLFLGPMIGSLVYLQCKGISLCKGMDRRLWLCVVMFSVGQLMGHVGDMAAVELLPMSGQRRDFGLYFPFLKWEFGDHPCDLLRMTCQGQTFLTKDAH